MRLDVLYIFHPAREFCMTLDLVLIRPALARLLNFNKLQ